MAQLHENKSPGQSSNLNKSQLLAREGIWIGLLYNLRNGTPEIQIETRGASGIFIKAKADKEKIYVSSKDETREQGGRETVYTRIAGQQPNVVKQPSIIESDNEMQNWQNKVEQVDRAFQRITMGDDPKIETMTAKFPERHIWEALKRAKTGAQVRRAYSRSKIWLVSRFEFPSGGYVDWSWSPYPRALYRHADAFCKAKLDPRYPARDDRDSGDYRRIEYFGRVMAGLSMDKPISPSYSVEVLRKMKHAQTCVCWRCLYRIAPRYSRSVVQFLREGSFEMSQPLPPDS